MAFDTQIDSLEKMREVFSSDDTQSVSLGQLRMIAYSHLLPTGERTFHIAYVFIDGKERRQGYLKALLIYLQDAFPDGILRVSCESIINFDIVPFLFKLNFRPNEMDNLVHSNLNSEQLPDDWRKDFQ